jgi:hypothetical protein
MTKRLFCKKEKAMEIKHIIHGVVLWSGDAPDIKTALMAATAAKTNLGGANLGGANLVEANLVRVNLRGANLGEADLRGANLRGANLVEANLVGANLVEANLWGANLRVANLVGAKYNINQVLTANWGAVSPEICAHLMCLDASALPDGERLMDAWAAGGPCPLSKSNGVDRVALFQQETKHWNLAKTLSSITLWELWERLAAEKDVKIR